MVTTTYYYGARNELFVRIRSHKYFTFWRVHEYIIIECNVHTLPYNIGDNSLVTK